MSLITVSILDDGTRQDVTRDRRTTAADDDDRRGRLNDRSIERMSSAEHEITNILLD